MDTFLTIIAGAFAGAVPGLIMWYLNRKKTQADTADVLVGTAMEMMKKLQERVSELECDYEMLNSEYKRLSGENKKLRKGVGLLINQLKENGYVPAWILEEQETE